MKLTEDEALEWFAKMRESKIYKLARWNLIKTGRGTKVKCHGVNFYEIHPIEVILEGYVILKKANQMGIKL